MCILVRIASLMLTIYGYAVCQTVDTDVGKFIGYVDNVSFNGIQRQVVKYIGIPYAEPTGGENRFAEPKPKQQLSEPYIANRTDLPNICPQLFGGYILAETTDGRMSEDCLHLSIYAPAGTLNTGSQKYPVLLWIHCGSFVVGLSDQYPGDVLSGFNDVILVVVNYRLNVFGFFSTGDGTVTGNQGLFDQALAIKWVHDHISNFGGDPKEVTLFGGSAGAVSVLYQAMYVGNEGYIKRAIVQSASPMAVANPNMMPFAAFAGCNQSTSTEVVKCLREMSWKDLSDKAENPNSGAHFAPVVDGKFIKRSLLEIIADPNSEEMQRFAKIDAIFGVNNLEGAMYMLPVYGKVVPGVREEDLKWISINVTHEMEISRPLLESTIMPSIIIPRTFPSGVPDIVKDAIISKYSDWNDPNNPKNIRDKVMDLTTDLEFAVNAVKSANARVQAVEATRGQANTYFYQYSYFSDIFKARPSWMHTGADHADEILSVLGFSDKQALFAKYHVTSYTPTPSDIKMSSLVMNYWVNFATTGLVLFLYLL